MKVQMGLLLLLASLNCLTEDLCAQVLLHGRVVPAPGDETLPGDLTVVLRLRDTMGTHSAIEAETPLTADNSSVIYRSISLPIDSDGNFEFRFSEYFRSENFETTVHPFDVLVTADGYATMRAELPMDEWWRRGELEMLTFQLQYQRPPSQRLHPGSAVSSAVPRSARREFEKASEYSRRNELDRALEQLDRALQLHPAFPDAYNNKGVIHLKQGDRVAAEHCFRSALSLDPNSVPALKNLGFVYLTTGREEESLPLLERAAQMDGTQAAIVGFLGEAYYQLKRYPEAEAPLKRALELDPGFFRASYRLGYVYLELKQYPQALMAFRKFLESNQGMDSTRVVELVRALESATEQ